VCIKKMCQGPGAELCAPEAETLFAFGRAIEAACLPAFQYLETQENLQISVFSCKNDV